MEEEEEEEEGEKKRSSSSGSGRRGCDWPGGGPGRRFWGRWWAGPGRAALLHLPAALVLTDIFPTAPCHSGIIAHDYGEDQHDRLSLISLTSVGEVIQAVTRIAPDIKSS